MKRVSIDIVKKQLAGTQCTACGYVDCEAYATAVVTKNEAINKCVPGGESVMLKLSLLLEVPEVALMETQRAPQVAVVDESKCIGCTMCLKVCPVDAVIGAPKQSHSILARDCTGCELCLAPCPTNCISLKRIPGEIKGTTAEKISLAWDLYEKKKTRLEKIREKRLASRKSTKISKSGLNQDVAIKIAEARAKAREKYSKND